MKYIVLMNNNYMNSFENYTQAKEFVEWLESKYKNNKITIETR